MCKNVLHAKWIELAFAARRQLKVIGKMRNEGLGKIDVIIIITFD